MKKKNYFTRLLFSFVVLLSVGISCSSKKDSASTESKDPKIANLKLPEGFHADHLYGPSENGEGSWVSMTFDDKGRIIASDQYGAMYRLKVPAIGDTSKTTIERINIYDNPAAADTAFHNVKIGHAHGLLWAFNSLYVMINNDGDTSFKKESGLYRLQDTNGDDQFDKVTLLKALDGGGEHGPHSVVLSPDKQSIYVIAGNFTKIPKMNAYRNIPDGNMDNLFPLIKDPCFSEIFIRLILEEIN